MGIDVWLEKSTFDQKTEQAAKPDSADTSNVPSANVAADEMRATVKTAQKSRTIPAVDSQPFVTSQPKVPVTVQGRMSADPGDAQQTADPQQAFLDQRQPSEPESTAPRITADRATTTAPISLAALQLEATTCQRCELHQGRQQSVFGQGNPNADWMFIGEAPGAEEDRQGLPFVGPAGQLLDAMLIAIGLAREEVYIANLVKCRPPRNRDPQREELAACQSYLDGQLANIKPTIIVALGRFAAQSLTGSSETIGRLRRQTHVHAATETPIVATYHPAYLLRSPAEKAKVWRDLLRARSLIEDRQQVQGQILGKD